ncbi:carbon storage regulator [Luxibacter massiliensis]|uniref:carbon storage regulator n=1 Tax=Luxibacter massiliensis TaxID=2219695 RepID=UPI000F044FDD|nr:carbon storage regulator [Luxibacter massiliensis]
MLILQRKKGQSLTINDNITLTVVGTGTDWVKLAIDAPKEIPILRSELKEAAAENKKASQAVPMHLLDEILREGQQRE